MSHRNDNGSGCLIQLVVLVTIIIIIFFVDYHNNSEKGMMNEAREHRDEYYYDEYLSKYPNGKYVNEAYDSILSILNKNTESLKIIDYARKYSGTALAGKLASVAYLNGLEKKDVSYWEYYIKNIDNDYRKEAEQQLALLYKEIKKEEQKKWGTDFLAWNSVQKQNTYEAYCKYVNLYPKGKHNKEARKAIIDMEVAKDFSGEHGQMPDLEKTSYGTGKYSSVYIENRTNYVLTILYSGTHSDKLSLSPHSKGSIRLPNDNYRISAKVNASNVIPYVGTAVLSGGDYSSSYYISSTRY